MRRARRRKHCTLRDVAGVLRSLNYATHGTCARLGGTLPDPAPLAAALRSAQVFLNAYRCAACSPW